MPERFLREFEVLKLVPVSTHTLRRWEAAGAFPKRRKLCAGRPGVVVWVEHEIVEWLEQRRTAATAPAVPVADQDGTVGVTDSAPPISDYS